MLWQVAGWVQTLGANRLLALHKRTAVYTALRFTLHGQINGNGKTNGKTKTKQDCTGAALRSSLGVAKVHEINPPTDQTKVRNPKEIRIFAGAR